MPGTIQVSILELVELPLVAHASSMSIKVSIGKQAHQMQDKGECSFPLASLRDNLKVLINDSGGNEIANAVVETRSIVEKGTWDDFFVLNGGGQVHMRLQFILSEDEQKRIRIMRESATRRKKLAIIKRSHSSSELATPSGGSSTSYQDSLKIAAEGLATPVDARTKSATTIFDAKASSGGQDALKKQAFTTSKSASALDKLSVHGKVKVDVVPREQGKRSSLEKLPSNVRKMIYAFESDPVKELSPSRTKIEAAPQVRSTIIADAPSNSPTIEQTAAVDSKPDVTRPVKDEALSASGGMEKGREANRNDRLSDQVTLVRKPKRSKELRVQFVDHVPNQKNTSEIQPSREEIIGEKQSPQDLQPAKKQHEEEIHSPRNLLISQCEQSKFSWGRLLQTLPRRKWSAPGLSNKQKRSSFSDALGLEKNWRSKHWKSLNHRVEAKHSYGSLRFCSYNFHGWIFLDEMISSCTPTDGRPFIDQLEGGLSDCSPNSSREKLADDGVASRDEWNPAQVKTSDSGSDPNNNKGLIGPAGQAVKIAIMAGFGILVFLTRQRK